MSKKTYSIITGTGSYIPTKQIDNADFLSNQFYDEKGNKLTRATHEITDKFLEITTIAQRRYAEDHHTTSDLAFLAATDAIASAGIDKEKLDYIIVATNFGDTKHKSHVPQHVPSMASRVKHKLGIENPETIAYDLTFGCPGWLQAVIQADYFIKSGDAKMILIIGAEILSRVCDPHDRDCMLYADGAGAIILESKESNTPVGILAHKTRSDAFYHSELLHMDKSFNPDYENSSDLFLKMNGRRLYQYALEMVPSAIKACLDKSNIDIREISKVLIHQANGKMDDAILARFYALYDIVELPDNIMPMTVGTLGNTSVATLPTLFDLIIKNKLLPHQIESKNTLIFASVGAGMNINALIYKVE
jgi:3-oxoacyl-[acyl-carrier-protein] synthase-3